MKRSGGHAATFQCMEQMRVTPCFFQVCAFNRTVEKVDEFLKKEAKGTKVIGADSLEDLVSKLKTPRRIILLVKGRQKTLGECSYANILFVH